MLYPHDLSPPTRTIDAAVRQGNVSAHWKVYAFSGGTAYTCIQPGVYEGPLNFGHIMRDIYGRATAEFVLARRAEGADDTGDEPVDSYLTFTDDSARFDILMAAAEAVRANDTPATRRAHRAALKLFSEPKSYCVCDNAEQALRYWKARVADPKRMYVIVLTKFERNLENRGKGVGWRWHKWGKYIGRKRPKYEYLDDEPNIAQVFVAECFEVQEHALPATAL